MASPINTSTNGRSESAPEGFAERFERSRVVFREVVWPLISHKFGPGSLVPCELEARDEVALVLDYAGIDYLFTPKGRPPYGISQRTMRSAPGCRSWDSFTFRPEAYTRLKLATERPFARLVPAVLVQSYYTEVTTGRVTVDGIGIVRTADLLTAAAAYPPTRKTGPGGEFLVFPFDALTAAGANVDRFPSPAWQSPW